MFDKLKDAVGDILQGNTETADKAVGDATKAVDNAASTAQGAVNSATGATDGASLENLAGDLSGFVNKAGGLDGIVGELGGLGGILEAVKGINFPIGVDDLAPILENAGLPSGIVDKLKNSGIGQIESTDQLVNLAKQFLSK